MTERLQKLLDQAKKAVPSAQEKEEQRRSFAYGNTKIENGSHRAFSPIRNDKIL
jgi:hypothetical protein